jgi:hypothetical protein
MDDAAAGGRSPPPGVKLISGQVAVLIRDALRPAQRDMARKASRGPRRQRLGRYMPDPGA